MLRTVVEVSYWTEWPKGVFPLIVHSICNAPEPFIAGSISYAFRAPMWRNLRREFTRMEDMKQFTDGQLMRAGLFKIAKGGEVYVE